MNHSTQDSLVRIRSVLERALQLHVPYGYPRPTGGTPSAVICTLRVTEPLPSGSLNGLDLLASLSVLIIQRAERDGDRHSGQMAFPGGTAEARDASLEMTALRECEEEVGLGGDSLKVVASLPSLGTPSGFQIHPFVALLESQEGDEPELRLDRLEVASALWIRLADFLKEACYSNEFREVGGTKYPIHIYELRGHRIWGATAAMIHNLIDRLKILGGEDYALFNGPVVVCSDAASTHQAETGVAERLATKALVWLGCEPERAVLARKGRLPIWPEGFTGAITHKSGLATVVAGRTAEFESLGIDSETVLTVQAASEIRNSITRPSEEAVVASLGWRVEETLTLIFSAKEAVYKAVSARLGLDIGFAEIEITSIDSGRHAFRYRIRTESGEGRFQRNGKTIRTAVEIYSRRFLNRP